MKTIRRGHKKTTKSVALHLRDHTIKLLEERANIIRQSVIEMLVEAGSGHTAGALGMADVFTALYVHIINHQPQKPNWEDRDRVILSNGHICPVQYASLAHAGYFSVNELLTLRKLGSRLQGHPHRESLPGIETTSGPLGSGLSQAAGMAYAARMDGKKFRTYCLMSDGEQDEGNTWEAVMFVGKNKLSNLTAIIDRNNIQIDGVTENIMPLESLKDKYKAFNWHVIDISGHNFREIIGAVEKAKKIHDKPTVIIAHTISGKGVKAIEGDYRWHGKPPTKDQAKEFLAKLRALRDKIKSK